MSDNEANSRAQRFAVIISAVLVDDRGQKIPVRIRNFSETGLGVITDQPLRVGQKVGIEMRDLSLAGEVVRKTGKVFGVRIDGQINPDDMTLTPVNKNAFVVSDLHKIEERAYRPGLKSPKSSQ